MVRSFKYRSVAIILAGVFMVFSIGIPVVLASCPMMTASVRGACCPAQPVKGLPILQTQSDYSCCKTVIASDRNKIEFLQTQTIEVSAKLQISIIPILPLSPSIDFQYISKIFLADTHSPPAIEDIPIFTSSLLI
jgi:hypothetical protein